MILEVVDGGLLTTVQDAGRREWTPIGVPVSGAADPWGLAVSNLLLGNDRGAAALEITIAGPTLRVREGGTIAIAGADLGAWLAGGRRLAAGRSHRLTDGDAVTFAGEAHGARTYLAVAGGVDVPPILGSRSTCLAAGFGGLDGRPLRGGDVVQAAWHGRDDGHELTWPGDRGSATASPGAASSHPVVLRVLPGLDPGLEALTAAAWRVGRAADRVGVRLDGDPLPPGIGGETLTHAVTWGAVQVPPDGRPIVLGVDHQTTGGYRVVAVVIAADRPALGQLRPGDEVRFTTVTPDEAVEALRAQRAALDAGADALREVTGWHRLAASAGG